MAVKGCAGIRRGKEKRKRMEMSRELWNWIATGGMDVWLEKCSIFQNKEKIKRNQRENKVKCHENCGYIATGGGGGGLGKQCKQCQPTPHSSA